MLSIYMSDYEVVTYNTLDQKMQKTGHSRLPCTPTGTKHVWKIDFHSQKYSSLFRSSSH